MTDSSKIEFWRRRIQDARDRGSRNPVRDGCYEWTPVSRGRMAAQARQLLHDNVRPTDHVLEVGCGTGSLCDLMPPCAAHHLTDLVPEFVEHARKCYGRSPRRSFAVLDLTDSQALDVYADNSFDLVVGRWVIEVIRRQVSSETFLGIILRLLRVAPKVITFDPGDDTYLIYRRSCVAGFYDFERKPCP